MSEDVPLHEISLAVWDLATPLVVGRPGTVKVGAKCSEGCSLTAQTIEILTEAEVGAGSGRLGPTPWPGTGALYWSEVDLIAPAKEGRHTWTVILTPSNLELPHTGAASRLSFLAVPLPEHCVTVRVVEKGTETPVGGVEVRLGPFRSVTGEGGFAKVELPGGSYDLVVWKLGYQAPPRPVEVAADTSFHVEIELAPEPEQEYWMG